MTIAICDDNPTDLLTLQNMIETYLSSRAQKVCHSFSIYRTGAELEEALKKKFYMDLYFLDIELDTKETGLHYAQKICAVHPNAIILFYSAYEKYAAPGYRTGAVRFLRKNMLHKDLPEAMEFALKRYSAFHSRSLIIEDKHVGSRRVCPNSIVYVKTEGHFISIHLNPEETLLTRNGIRSFFAQLNDRRFVFLDKGIVVNLEYVQSVGNYSLTLLNGKTIPISRRNFRIVKEEFINYVREA